MKNIYHLLTSTGVRPTDFFGSFYMANTTDMELAALNTDMSLACEIKHDDKLTDEVRKLKLFFHFKTSRKA